MDRYNCKKCLALEDAIDTLGLPSHVEINEGELQITILGTTMVSQEQSRGGITFSIPIPDRTD